MAALPCAASVCIAAAFLDKDSMVKGGLWCCQVTSVSFCSALNLSVAPGQPHRLESSVKIRDAQRDTAFASWGSQGPTGLEGCERRWLKISRNEHHSVVGHTSWKGWQILQLRKKDAGGVSALKATCSVCKVVPSRWMLAGVQGQSMASVLRCAETHLLRNKVGWNSKKTQGLNNSCQTSPCWRALCWVPPLLLLLCPQAGEGAWESCREEFLPLWY